MSLYKCNSCKCTCDESNLDYIDYIYMRDKICPACASEDIKPVKEEEDKDDRE